MTCQTALKPVGVVLITHQSCHHLAHCLPPLQRSRLSPEILVVNSSSTDGTIEEAKRLGVDVWVIPRHTFNHGTTRELARKKLQTPIVVMMTPDAYLADETMLEKLVAPIQAGQAAATYARQIPHLGADRFEQFSRDFQYASKSMLYGIEACHTLGTQTFFFSNSCSAYCQHALDAIGGFKHVRLAEDTLAAAALLKQHYKIAYVAESVVRHSHRYTLSQEFCRHFDIGSMRHELSMYGHQFKMDRSRGMRYARHLLAQIAQESPHKLPYALLHLFCKWSGYQIGRLSPWIPDRISRLLSSQDFYWESKRTQSTDV